MFSACFDEGTDTCWRSSFASAPASAPWPPVIHTLIFWNCFYIFTKIWTLLWVHAFDILIQWKGKTLYACFCERVKARTFSKSSFPLALGMHWTLLHVLDADSWKPCSTTAEFCFGSGIHQLFGIIVKLLRSRTVACLVTQKTHKTATSSAILRLSSSMGTSTASSAMPQVTWTWRAEGKRGRSCNQAQCPQCKGHMKREENSISIPMICQLMEYESNMMDGYGWNM